MMASPHSYVEYLKDAEYPELIKERDRLIRSIRAYEKKEIAGDRKGQEWLICPGPDVEYQMDLEYLGALCAFMSKRYNRQYVNGDGDLRADALEYGAKKKKE